jgi:DNA-binding transcriptional ArsR family regulator
MEPFAPPFVTDMDTRQLILSFLGHKKSCQVRNIADEFGTSMSRITYHLKILKYEGFIHISAWKPDEGGTPRAVWSLGNSPDAPRPTAKPTRHKRGRVSTIIKIRPDIASAWLQLQPYTVIRRYIRTQRSGELGVRPSTSANYQTEQADSAT